MKPNYLKLVTDADFVEATKKSVKKTFIVSIQAAPNDPTYKTLQKEVFKKTHKKEPMSWDRLPILTAKESIYDFCLEALNEKGVRIALGRHFTKYKCTSKILSIEETDILEEISN